MVEVARLIFPLETDYGRRFCALGVHFITLGLQLSPDLQDVLANDLLLALGKHSFAVYLIHGTLLRSLLVWALYGIRAQPGKASMGTDGADAAPIWLARRFSGLPFLMVTALWMVWVYYCAGLWTTYVDVWCARLTQRLEDITAPRSKETLDLNMDRV